MFRRFSAGLAVGYVLGARAGEKRYEQMTDLAERALDVPVVGRLADRATEMFTPENGRQMLQTLKDRAMSMRSSDEEDAEDDSDSEDEDEDDYAGARESGEDDHYEDEDFESESEGYDEPEGRAEDEDSAEDEGRSSPRTAGRQPARGRSRETGSRNGRRSSERRTQARPDGQRQRSGAGGDRPHRGRIRNLASAAIERGRID